jgi:hypothetical protein
MLTIVEAPGFSRLWPDYWTEETFSEFCAFLALHPDAHSAGDLRGIGK